MSNFKQLNLNGKILNSLVKKGYTTPTPIQTESIPHLLNQKDLLGIAQTGTGKTAAFSLPILHNLIKSNNKVRNNNIRALILTPTRELASQILDNIKRYGEDLGLKSEVIFGGVNINNQIRFMKEGLDIIVATPGRFLDLMNQKHIRLSQIEIFVLDEADRMLDMGFIRDIRKIVARLPEKRQNLLFSATMPKDIASLANSLLNNPVRVEVTPPSTTVEKIEQRLNFIEKSAKPLLLKSILNQKDVQNVLIFTKTKHGANRVVKFLDADNYQSAAIHGNKSQSAREAALKDFRNGKINILVATDIAARGIDITNITHVINYDMPQDPESYVHRIGRTGRAGKSGVAISFYDSSEKELLKAVEKTIKYKIPIDPTHPLRDIDPDQLKAAKAGKNMINQNSKPKNNQKNKHSQGSKKSRFTKNKNERSDATKPSPDADSESKKSTFGKKKESRFGSNNNMNAKASFNRKKKKKFNKN